MSLGRLETAVSFYKRQNKMQLEQEGWRCASLGYQNLTELNAAVAQNLGHGLV
jgi:hypothetical protein